MNTDSADIIVIGSINTDMVVKAEQLPQPGQTVLGGEFFMSGGGKGANQAVAAARLGGRVNMVGCVGADVFGKESVERLQEEGIDCRGVHAESTLPSGVALINVEESGENQIVVAPGANAAVSKSQVDAALASATETTLVLLQLEIPMEIVTHAVNIASSKGCRVILDPAPASELPRNLLDGVYLITPNESEAAALTGEKIEDAESAERATQALLARGASHVALTLGSAGVLLASASGSKLISAKSVATTDTTAAGDCFCGAVAAALARGDELLAAISYANQAAAISVTRLGAQPALPYANEIETA